MSPLPFDRDEIVSAYLDGEATAEERAVVEADPALLERVASLGRVRDLLAAPLPPSTPGRADAHIDAALAALARQPARAPKKQRSPIALRWAGAAAAIALVIAGATAVLANRDGDDGSSATAASTTARGANKALEANANVDTAERSSPSADRSAAPAAGGAISSTTASPASTTAAAAAPRAFSDDDALRRALAADPTLAKSAPVGAIASACADANPAALSALVAGRAVAVVVLGAGRYRVVDLATCASRELAV